MWQAAQRLVDGAGLSGRARNAVIKFIELIEGLNEFSELPLPDLCEKAIEHSGLIAHFEKQKGEKDQMRVENLEELANAARQFATYSSDGLSPLTAFLSHTALEAGEEQGPAQQDSVQLMTLHSAKGWNFPWCSCAAWTHLRRGRRKRTGAGGFRLGRQEVASGRLCPS